MGSMELISKTSLETHKLDLMAETSNLKLKLATSEREKRELTEKLERAQKRNDEFQCRLNEKNIELNECRGKLAKNGTISNSTEHTGDSLGRAGSTERSERTLERERTLDRLKRKHCEVDKLKKAVESLVISNDEKDSHIEELRQVLKRYRKVEDLISTDQGKKALESLGFEDEWSDGSSHNSASSHDNTVKPAPYAEKVDRLQPTDRRPPPHMPYPSATSTPVNSYTDSLRRQNGHHAPVSPLSIISPASPTPTKPLGMRAVRSSSLEDLTPTSHRTPPTVHKRPEGFGTLPAQMSSRTDTLPPTGAGAGTGSTVPRKIPADEDEATKDELAQEYKAMQMGVHEPQKKKKGIRRLFGRLKRSSSQDLEGDRLEDFKRGGVRSTANARLGWSTELNNFEVPFARWDRERVAAWMHAIGLSMYVGECKRWVKNGSQLLRASHHDLEKELGMRNVLHRKKLQLALQSLGTGAESRDRANTLDHNWVSRWLDDIGLPQYKDTFTEARVDGRMLHHMTVEDLVSLRVTNTLHHLSIKTGIQVLRVNNFNPICLKRRPAPDEGKLQDCPHEVQLWTNHRVMEWLRTIDFSEYAPNLRGSGVHGALMVLEPRFSAEVFAAILSIPPNKTLLRRHLNTHFVSLIGNATQQKKRALEIKPGNIPLTPNQKIKVRKFGLFAHKRTRSTDTDGEDLVCPMGSVSNGLPRGKERDDVAAKEIGVFSSEINTLTHMLDRDRFEDMPASNV